MFTYRCNIFYFYFQELENVFSEHFGWTANSTPFQVADHEDSSDNADDDGLADDTIDLDRRVILVLSDPNQMIKMGKTMKMNIREAQCPLMILIRSNQRDKNSLCARTS